MSERVDYRGSARSHKWIMDEFYRTGGVIHRHESTETATCATISHPETYKVIVDKHIDDYKTTGWNGTLVIVTNPKEELMDAVIRDGMAQVFTPILQQHWFNYIKSHAVIPNEDPVFDQYMTGEKIER